MTMVVVIHDTKAGTHTDQGYHAHTEDVRDELVHLMKKSPHDHDIACSLAQVSISLPGMEPEMFESVSNHIFRELGDKFVLTHSWRII